MAILVDGREQSALAAGSRTVGEILAEIQKGLAGSGRMIVAIVCDGRTLAPEELTAVFQEKAESYQDIDFQTAVPAEVARAGLDASRAFVADIRETGKRVVDDIHQSRLQEARINIGDMFGKLGSAYQGLEGTFRLMKIDPESVELSSGSAKKFINGLKGNLSQIRDALENQDYVGFADLLEYELEPALKEWEELIDQLLETLGTE